MRQVTCGSLKADDWGEGEVWLKQMPTERFGALNADGEPCCDLFRDWIRSLECEYVRSRIALWRWIDANKPHMSEDDRIKLDMVELRHPRPTSEEIENQLKDDSVTPVKFVGKPRKRASNGT